MTDFISEAPPEGMLELPDCAPTRALPSDLQKSIGVEEGTHKYYATTLLGISTIEIPNVDLPNDKISEEHVKLLGNVMQLLKENDICDKVGIRFLATVYSQACNTTFDFGKELCSQLTASKTAIARLAILYETESKKLSS